MLATLQKFGLRHHDLPTMLWNAAVLFRALALDIDSGSNKRLPIILYVISAIIIVLYVYTYHLSMYWFIWRGEGTTVFNLLLISLAIASTIGFVKLLYMYTNGTKLKKLLKEYLECDAALAPDSRMSRNVNATLRSVKRRAVIFWLIVIGNGIFYYLTPIFTPGRHLPEDGQILLGLEPMHDSPNFEIAYIVLFGALFMSVYAPANITGFFIIIVGYNESQMLALAQELLHLWEDAQSHYKETQPDCVTNDIPSGTNYTTKKLNSKKKERIVNAYLKIGLVSVIKGHATNIKLIMQVESFFKNAIAIEFILLTGSLITELLGGLENTYSIMPYAFVQVAMDCLAGQRLMDASKVFEEAVYSCNWECFDVSNRRLVLVILQNAQKTMHLSAGGLPSLSYTTLMSVIRSIYSGYTALRSTMN